MENCKTEHVSDLWLMKLTNAPTAKYSEKQKKIMPQFSPIIQLCKAITTDPASAQWTPLNLQVIHKMSTQSAKSKHPR